jgi:hypothetical protein
MFQWERRGLEEELLEKYISHLYTYDEPVPMAAQSNTRTIFDRSKIGIAGSNPERFMDVCPRFSVSCCPV